MKERTIDLLTAVFLILFSLLMRAQLENIPREGVLFPLCVLYLIMGCSVLLAVRAVFTDRGKITFFGDISPLRWGIISGLFLLEALGAMYLSFNLCMSLGMFAMLIILTPREQRKNGWTGRNLLLNLVFTAAFIMFFQLFFTDIMHIYFPEPFLG